MRAKRQNGVPALALMEEAFHLVRRAPFSALAAYYLGSLPFVLALLYFWADMTQRTTSDEYTAEFALVLALLFLWMKCWQTIFARRLLAELRGEGAFPWSFRRLCRMAVAQSAIQPFGLFLLPVALLLTVPFGWAYALYQNVTILGDGENADLRSLLKRCSRLGSLWPRQNFFAIWILSPMLVTLAGVLTFVVLPIIHAIGPIPLQYAADFNIVMFTLLRVVLCPLGLIVSLNIQSALAMLPALLRMLLGVETQFSLGRAAMFSPTFSVVVCGLTYLAMDPLMKAVYVLRCFYGESLTNGDDLKVALKKLAPRSTIVRAGLIVVALFCFSGAAHADEKAAPATGSVASSSDTPSVSAQSLDRAITTVLDSPEYAWRLPREDLKADEQGLVARFLRAVADTVRDWIRAIHRVWRAFQDWLHSFHPEGRSRDGDHSPFQWSVIISNLSYLVLAALIAVVLILCWRIWQTRARTRIATAQPAATEIPDVEDENVLASALPEDEWLNLARDLASKGDYRLALRALFLASLAHLAAKEFIRVAKFKSNRDYLREIARRGHAVPELRPVFGHLVDQFERVWYGTHEATSEGLEQFEAEQRRIQSFAQ